MIHGEWPAHSKSRWATAESTMKSTLDRFEPKILVYSQLLKRALWTCIKLKI
jgi:hypothetical protein